MNLKGQPRNDQLFNWPWCVKCQDYVDKVVSMTLSTEAAIKIFVLCHGEVEEEILTLADYISVNGIRFGEAFTNKPNKVVTGLIEGTLS